MIVIAPIGGRISRERGPKTTLVIGTLIAFIGMAGLAIAHETTAQLYLWPTVMYSGVGFAFGAIPLLILQSVARSQSGQSTSLNLTMRNAGSSIGVQLAATFVAASAIGRSGPTEGGFGRAFTLEASAALCAFLLALAIPGPGPQPREVEAEEIDEAVLRSEV
jgi:MFS family permease